MMARGTVPPTIDRVAHSSGQPPTNEYYRASLALDRFDTGPRAKLKGLVEYAEFVEPKPTQEQAEKWC